MKQIVFVLQEIILEIDIKQVETKITVTKQWNTNTYMDVYVHIQYLAIVALKPLLLT